MKYVLHTHAVGALMKGNDAVVGHLTATRPSDIGIPQPVIAEIAFGIARLPESTRRDELQSRFELLCGELPRAPWTDDVSLAYARIKAEFERRSTPIDDFDAAIAAHALAMRAILVTARAQHMNRIRGLTVENWNL